MLIIDLLKSPAPTVQCTIYEYQVQVSISILIFTVIIILFQYGLIAVLYTNYEIMCGRDI